MNVSFNQTETRRHTRAHTRRCRRARAPAPARTHIHVWERARTLFVSLSLSLSLSHRYISTYIQTHIPKNSFQSINSLTIDLITAGDATVLNMRSRLVGNDDSADDVGPDDVGPADDVGPNDEGPAEVSGLANVTLFCDSKPDCKTCSAKKK